MNENKTDALLREAMLEIRSLRESNRYMSIRLQMFDDCMRLLKSRQEGGVSECKPDVCYQIERLLEENESLAKKQAE